MCYKWPKTIAHSRYPVRTWVNSCRMWDFQMDALNQSVIARQKKCASVAEPAYQNFRQSNLCAEGGIRTRIPFRALPPQDSVSTNFTTSAWGKKLKLKLKKSKAEIHKKNPVSLLCLCLIFSVLSWIDRNVREILLTAAVNTDAFLPPARTLDWDSQSKLSGSNCICPCRQLPST